MYTVYDYGRMMCDEVRMRAYLAALERRVTPGCVVADLGTGTGIFALAACKLGARRVYAIDPNPAIEVARELARENGVADRITFFRSMSTEVELPEKVDVIVSDMRGQLPLAGNNLQSLLDARARFLAPNGAMIPERDALMCALVEAPALYDDLVAAFAAGRFLGLSQNAARVSVVQSAQTDRAAPIDAPQLLMPGAAWAAIDYARFESPSVAGAVEAKATRAGTAHGVCLWFETALAPAVSFTTGPGPDSRVYGRAFLPLESPVAVEPGDGLRISLRLDPDGVDYNYAWETRFTRGDGRVLAAFRQTSFLGAPLSRDDFLRASGEFRPTRNERAEAWREILAAMDGETPSVEIAARIHARFPKVYRTIEDASAEVRSLSRRLSA
jgi:protein arginine N-methyltransferase 1